MIQRIPSEESVRQRAYELWQQDGRPDGKHIEYWLQASRELEEEDNKNKDSGRKKGVAKEAPARSALT